MSKKTYSEKAYEIVKDNLMSGKYDSYINGSQVAKSLGIGYTPVREAFLRLQSEGLIRKEGKSGYFVNKPDLRDIIKIFQVRECIEIFVWEQTFDKITDADIFRMKTLHDQEKQYLAVGNIPEYSKIDLQFHGVMLTLYGNADLSDLYFKVRQKNMLFPVNAMSAGTSEALKEHAQLIALVEAKDKQRAIQMLHQHIVNTQKRVQEGCISFM